MTGWRPATGAAALAEIDWTAVRRRMDAAATAIERGLAPTVDDTRRILEVRARALARQQTAEGHDALDMTTVDFVLARERHAVEIRFVTEVCSLESLTALPGTPPFMLGIMTLRGEIVPVVDLRQIFDLPRTGLTDFNKVVVLKSGQRMFGILADVILGVFRLPERSVQPPPPTLTGIRGDFLKGVTAERVVVLDAEKLLTDARLAVGQRESG